MNTRILIFWLLSTIALFCCVFISFEKATPKQIESNDITSLLIAEPQSFYFSNNKYRADVIGKLKLEIKKEPLAHNLLDYDAFVIRGLEIDHNSSISLNWKIENQVHQVPLNSNKHSINRVNFNTTDVNEISEIYILISSNFELGTRPNAPKEVAFKSVFFDSTQNHSSVSIKLNQWFDYTPLKFNSINGYSSSDNLHFKTLIQRLSIWVFFNIALFILLGVSGHQLIISLSLAWLVTLALFSKNLVQQKQQIQSAYEIEDQFLNQQDISAHQLAQEITAKIQITSSTDRPQQKFIIIGNNDFFHLRLYHHLKRFNVAIKSSELVTLLENDLNKQYIYILTNNLVDYCKTDEKIGDSFTEIIGQDAHYCLLRKI